MDSKWDSHKEEIGKLYLQDNKPLSSIVSFLKEEKGFSVSKSQLEWRLRKWNFRKNLKASDWRAVASTLAKRRRHGKESTVYISGVAVPESKVHKEIRRYVLQTNQTATGSSPPPTSPPWDVCTPSYIANDLYLPPSLPWIRFQLCLQGFPVQDTPLLSMEQKLVPDSIGNQHTTASSPHSVSENSPPTAMSLLLPGKRAIDSGDWSSFVPFPTGRRRISRSSLKRICVDLRQVTLAAAELVSPSSDPDSRHFQDLSVLMYAMSNNLLPLGVTDSQIMELFRSISGGQLAAFGNLLKENQPTAQAFVEAALASAVRAGDEPAASFLLRAGAVVDVQMEPPFGWWKSISPNVRPLTHLPSSGWTPLKVATITGDLALVRLLLDHGAGSGMGNDEEGSNNFSPLQIAASLDDGPIGVAIARCLLEAGAKVDNTGAKVLSPLLAAVACVNHDMVSLLLKYGADENWTYYSRHSASVRGTSGRLSALSLAVETGDDMLLQTLIHIGTFSSTIVADALVLAVHRRHSSAVKGLIHYGPNHAIEGTESALLVAAARGYSDICELLLEAGVNPNPTPVFQQTSRLIPLSGSNYSRLKPLGGQNITEPKDDVDIATPLQAALHNGHEDTAVILIRHGSLAIGSELEMGARFGSWKLYKALSGLMHAFDSTALQNDQSCLHAALEGGNIELAEYLLTQDISLIGGELILAIEAKADRVADELLRRGAFVDPHEKRFGRTIFETSLVTGNNKLSDAILSGSPFVYDAGALCAGTWLALGTIVQRLLTHRGGTSRADLLENTALGIAVAAQRSASLLKETFLGSTLEFTQGRLPIQLDYGFGYPRPTVLPVAAYWWHVPTYPIGSPLLLAVLAEDKALVSLLLLRGLVADYLTLAYVVEKGDMVTLGRLMATSAPINARDDRYASLLQIATWKGHLAVVELLIGSGADVNEPAGTSGLLGTALQNAIDGSTSLDLVKTLLYNGADVNIVPDSRPGSRFASTPLQMAVKQGNIDLVRLLMDAGADVNAFSANGIYSTALYAGVANGHNDIVEILISSGADVNACPAGSQGGTVLQIASALGYVSLAVKLIQSGADVNAPAKVHGRTALEAAAENGRLDMVSLLLYAGALRTNAHYWRAIKFAIKQGHLAVAAILRAAREWTSDDEEMLSRVELDY